MLFIEVVGCYLDIIKCTMTIGSCAAFGGVPAANMNPSGAKSVMTVFKEQGIPTPTINLPGS